MPWWAIAYFGSVVILLTGGVLESVQEFSWQNFSMRKWTFECADFFVRTIIPGYFFLSFWFLKLADFFGILSPVLVFVAVALHIHSWPKTAAELYESETRLSHQQKKKVLLALAIYESPLYIVAVVAVLRNYFH